MTFKYGAVVLVILFAGFRLTEAVQTNTQQAAANVVVLESLSTRVDGLEHWKADSEAYDRGYRAAVEESGESK